MEEDDALNEEEDLRYVLAQERSNLQCVLGAQSPEVAGKLWDVMSTSARRHADRAAGQRGAAAMLDDVLAASGEVCTNFVQAMCMLCEGIPIHLESRLVSVAGCTGNSSKSNRPKTEKSETSLMPPPEGQATKRARMDCWENYNAAVRTLLLQRWEALRLSLVRDVQLEDTWVGVRHTNRARDRPDQTPRLGDRGSRTPDLSRDSGSPDSRVTLESFFQDSAGRITVLLGPAGSGKTLGMSCLGRHWAKGLGPIPSTYLFVLLEFRQLNLLSRPLSLSELLFHYYIPPPGGDKEQSAVLDYLLSNPEQSCWMLDGYDEFHSKIPRLEEQKSKKLLDPKRLLPITELISGLISRQILPGCTLVITCRTRNVIDLEGIADKVGELLGWDHHEVKEYVVNYFRVKDGMRSKAEQAMDLLLSNQHLIAMSSLPALCNVCCVCLEHCLEQQGEDGERGRQSENQTSDGGEAFRTGDDERAVCGEGGSRGGGQQWAQDNEESCQERRAEGGGEDTARAGANEEEAVIQDSPPCSIIQFAPSFALVYLTVLEAFLSRSARAGAYIGRRPDHVLPPPQSSIYLPDLGQYRSKVCELSRLAWKGLEEGRILFMETNIPQHVLQFSTRAGLFTRVELRGEGGFLQPAYCFIHLTLQEFLAALRIMTSADVTEKQLKQKFNLKTRWTTKSDRKTVFTDSLHLYMCGLAAPHCTPALVQIARGSGVSGAQGWVQKRQALVLKLLKNLCGSTSLTGPKVLQLCQCIQEAQDRQLAQELVSTRTNLELRNIRLLPSDISALAFVTGSAGGVGIGLDLGGCSLDPECLDALPSCRYIHSLTFRSRKYDDKLAEKLSSILPQLCTLRKLEYTGANLSDVGATHLVTALKDCPDITEINLSDNNLTDTGMSNVSEILTELPNLASVMLGHNRLTLQGVYNLIEKMVSCVNLQHFYVDGLKEIKIIFSQKCDINRHENMTSNLRVSLLNLLWSESEMLRLCHLLSGCSSLSVLDLSGGQMGVETIRTLTKSIPILNIMDEIIVKDFSIPVNGLVTLTALLRTCPAVVKLSVRQQKPCHVSVLFQGGVEQPKQDQLKELCLSSCCLIPAVLGRVLKSLGRPSDLAILDLSNNSLGNKGLKKLLDHLPHLSCIQEINASRNDFAAKEVVLLATAFSSHQRLTEVHASDGCRDQVILKFSHCKSDEEEQLKYFRLTHSSILPSDLTNLCHRLSRCPSPLELDLSHSPLEDQAARVLLKVIPYMASLQTLDVSHCITSIDVALTLAGCLTDNQQVKSVEIRRSGESIIQFDDVKAEHICCRITHFTLNSDDLERLAGTLEKCPQIADLDLSNNLLQDEGLKFFVKTLFRLNISRTVNLSNNGLSQQGALHVAGTLCPWDKVSGIKLSLGEEKSTIIAFNQGGSIEKSLSTSQWNLDPDHLAKLSEILRGCPGLTKLEFRNNSLSAQGITDLVKTLNTGHRKRSVSIEESWIQSKAAVSLVCRCLDVCSDIDTIRVLRTTLHLSLAKFTEPSSKSLVDCAVEGCHLVAVSSVLQRSPLLTELDLSHNNLGGEGAEFLCSILPSLTNFTTLCLSGHVLGDRDAEILAGTFPRMPCLTSVDLSHCSGWSPAGGLALVRALGQCVQLEGLCLDSVPLDEDFRLCLAQGLHKTNSIRRLNLNKVVSATRQSGVNVFLELLVALAECRQMEEIELEGWSLGDAAVLKLTEVVPLWPGLRKIRLSKNSISDQSAENLLEALKVCNQLEELHLSSNSVTCVTAAKMVLVLPSLTHLSVLDLSDNSLGHEGAVSLSTVLVHMKSLTKIYLTSVGTSELCAVASSLVHCPLIQDVSFGWNGCGDNVALELSKVLPQCQKLIRLDLESNNITVIGAVALFRALHSCPALQFIRLWRNKICSAEARTLSLRDRRLSFLSI